MKIILLLLSLQFSTAIVHAQTAISLKAAIDSALNQNPAAIAATLKARSAKAFETTAYDIPFTGINAEYGKINSVFNDTKLAISQTVSFPVVYKRQKELLQAHTQSFVLNENIIKVELKKQVTYLYYQLLVLQKRRALLLGADSLFRQFAQKQEQRFKAGDAGILEKTAAATQLMQVSSQLNQLTIDYNIVQLQLGRLLHSGTLFIPADEKIKIEDKQSPDLSAAVNFPVVKLKEQQQDISVKEIEVHKARNLPQFTIGYTNQSIAGIQNINGVDKHFTAANRFSSAMVGLNVPLFNKANKARIAAGKINYTIAKTEYEETLKQHESMVQQLLLKKTKHQSQLAYFETSALLQARIITENANLQFANGAINYLEWIMLTNQAIGIQAEYITAVYEWNTTIIELNAYSNN